MTHRTPKPECPRCGYDQTGVVNSWKDRCPLKSVCSECGLNLDWSEVLGPNISSEHRNFESLSRVSLRALLVSITRVPRPRKLWSSLGMDDQIRLGRASIVAAGALLCYSALLLTLAFLTWFVDGRLAWRGFSSADIDWVVRIASDRTVDRAADRVFSVPFLWLQIWFAALPLCFVLIPDSLRRAKAKPIHLYRAVIYAAPIPSLLALAWVVAFALDDLIMTVGYQFWNQTFDTRFATTWRRLARWVIRYDTVLLATVVFVVLWWYWSAFFHRYLRLEHPRAVAAALMIVAGLAAMFVLLPFPGALRELIGAM